MTANRTAHPLEHSPREPPPGLADRGHLSSLGDGRGANSAWMFNDPLQIRALRELILAPRLLSSRSIRPLTIWSAGCGTGEETYALAMLCLEVDPNLTPDRVRILGTDVNPFRLEQAARAIYRARPPAQSPLWPHSSYVEPLGDGSFRMARSVRRLVSFTQHNVLNDRLPVDPGQVALVCCREVLADFRSDDRARALELLAHSLDPRGWLLLGQEESAPAGRGWETVERPGCLLYRKRAAGSLEAGQSPQRQRRRSSASRLAPRPRGAFRPATPTQALEAMAQLETAIALQQRGDDTAALAALSQALKLDRHLVLAHFFSAGIHERQDRPRQARRHYELVLALLEGRSLAEIVPQSNGVSVSFVRDHAARRLTRISEVDAPCQSA